MEEKTFAQNAILKKMIEKMELEKKSQDHFIGDSRIASNVYGESWGDYSEYC